MDYQIGDTITYRTTSEIRTGIVVDKDPDIKNGRPGFDLVLPNGDEVWGYDEQIVRVDRRANA